MIKITQFWDHLSNKFQFVKVFHNSFYKIICLFVLPIKHLLELFNNSLLLYIVKTSIVNLFCFVPLLRQRKKIPFNLVFKPPVHLWPGAGLYLSWWAGLWGTANLTGRRAEQSFGVSYDYSPLAFSKVFLAQWLIFLRCQFHTDLSFLMADYQSLASAGRGSYLEFYLIAWMHFLCLAPMIDYKTSCV